MNFSSACCCNGCFCPLTCPAVILTDQTWNIDLHQYFMSASLLKVAEASPFSFYRRRGWNFNNCKRLTDWTASWKKTEISFLFFFLFISTRPEERNNHFQRSNLKVFCPITLWGRPARISADTMLFCCQGFRRQQKSQRGGGSSIRLSAKETL